MTCPNCGRTLAKIDPPNAATPLWLCDGCSRGWWDAELTTPARRLWNSATRSFGTTPEATEVRLRAMGERDTAVANDRRRRR